jgi:two-component system nitrogen regulation response regulator GlnG
MSYLATQDLPGNVRQLENVCHWLTVMSPTQVIEIADFPPDLRDETAEISADWLTALAREVDRLLAGGETKIMERLSNSFEKTCIEKALAHTGGRRIEAAGLLGIGRNTITRKIGELGIGDENSLETS